METDEDRNLRSTHSRRRVECSGRPWSTEETDFLIGMYYKNVHNIGPDKLFRSKIHLWNEISSHLNRAFNLNRTTFQCVRRFKALRRNSKHKVNGRCLKAIESSSLIKSSTDEEDPFAEEDIETQREGNLLRSSEEESTVADLIRSTLLEIHYLKEEAKERRHRERMQLLQQFLPKKETIQTASTNSDSFISKKVLIEPVMQPSVSSTEIMRERLLEMQRKKMEDRERKKKISTHTKK